ncbi:RING-box protein 2 isoform X5 [Pipistrellus kuhlii]|uniref:RING-box protein 2 isoform X5 n=1 Tax=Pipistrellus kuhlii TaxID=59472 RepID=UPI00174F1301|nr:RING-box protein 2 isoform X5 [Pipistrellus kuhlii]
MADVEDGDEPCALSSHSGGAGSKSGGDKMFSLKKWNAVAMWSWDVECDTCAICRVQVMDACLRCQAENKQEDCVGGQLYSKELCRNWGHHIIHRF